MEKSKAKFFLIVQENRNFLYKTENNNIYQWLRDQGRFEKMFFLGKEISEEEAVMEML